MEEREFDQGMAAKAAEQDSDSRPRAEMPDIRDNTEKSRLS